MSDDLSKYGARHADRLLREIRLKFNVHEKNSLYLHPKFKEVALAGNGRVFTLCEYSEKEVVEVVREVKVVHPADVEGVITCVIRGRSHKLYELMAPTKTVFYKNCPKPMFRQLVMEFQYT